ncbi:MAG: hypothetical protein C0402_03315 [Thermodesulfovibrio sp.]|nr:hypothetical protein [Thermodesulfovibrio sp.]
MEMRATKEGKRSVLATVLIGVAAVNTGNNLIYLVLSLLLSFLLLAYLIPRLILSQLRIELAFDGQIYAGEPSRLTLSIFNDTRLLPSYSVHVTSAVLPETIVLPHLDNRGHLEKVTRAIFYKRGLHPVVSFALESSFPFIFFYAIRKMDIAKNIVVYPAYYDADLPGDSGPGTDGDRKNYALGSGDEMVHIRHFREGDDPRQISWKASSKGLGLMVREYALQESGRTTVVLGNSDPKAGGDFEKAVSIAATLARDLIRGGRPVRLVAGSEVVPFGSGYEHLLQILDMLALVREGGPGEDSGQGFFLPDESGEFILVLKSAEAGRYIVLPDGARIIYADTV